jgi:hypothetical protein
MSHDHLHLVDTGVIRFEPMSQPDIPPALTPDEWAKVRSHEHAMANSLLAWEPEDMPAVVAIANAAMFSDDPRKITRDQVTALAVVAEVAMGNNGRVAMTGADATRLYYLAAKLAALLPPE